MFGLSQNTPATTGPFSTSFGGTTQQTGAFGQSQPQQSTSFFGQPTQSQQQQSNTLFGLGQSQNAQPQQQQQQPAASIFGDFRKNNQSDQSLQQMQSARGLFGGTMLGQSAQQQIFPQLGQIANQSFNPREKSIPEQMAAVLEKWDIGSPNCVFKHYFYNKVGEELAVFYAAGPQEEQKAWDDALSKKPGPGYVPVLCTGFAQLGERIKFQQQTLTGFNTRLHEINDCLSKMMTAHETQTGLRILEARRKHVVLKQRCLALATKVQTLRNRGYAMSGDEELLKSKLTALERQINDPGLGARGEEIWARMLAVEDRARILKSEIEKSGDVASVMLDDELSHYAKQILEDYNTQLNHLKKEMKTIVDDYKDWAKDHGFKESRPKTDTKPNTPGDVIRFL